MSIFLRPDSSTLALKNTTQHEQKYTERATMFPVQSARPLVYNRRSSNDWQEKAITWCTKLKLVDIAWDKFCPECGPPPSCATVLSMLSNIGPFEHHHPRPGGGNPLSTHASPSHSHPSPTDRSITTTPTVIISASSSSYPSSGSETATPRGGGGPPHPPSIAIPHTSNPPGYVPSNAATPSTAAGMSTAVGMSTSSVPIVNPVSSNGAISTLLDSSNAFTRTTSVLTRPSESSPASHTSRTSPVALIAAAVVTSIIGFLLLVGAALWWRRRSKRRVAWAMLPEDQYTEISYGECSSWSVRSGGYTTRSVTPRAASVVSSLSPLPVAYSRNTTPYRQGSPPGSPSPLMLASPFTDSASIARPQGHGGGARPDVPMDVALDDGVLSGGVVVDRSVSPGKALSLSTSLFSDGQSGKQSSPTA
ncbi:hypothetical protein C8Q76DRAFT_113083 [Earliella scabrosa]|nr:hypothetical protein C8Q76DRAFT_113083 [Earliella scabrosa]